MSDVNEFTLKFTRSSCRGSRGSARGPATVGGQARTVGARAEAGFEWRFAPRWHHSTRRNGSCTYRSEVLRRDTGEVERAHRREGERQREHRDLCRG